MKIYLQQNKDKKAWSKQPDLRLSQITDKGDFVEIGALWKSLSGKGYSGRIDLTKIDDLLANFEVEQAESQKERDEAKKEKVEVQEPAPETVYEDEINPNEIPF